MTSLPPAPPHPHRSPAREQLRRHFLPTHTRFLFIGEAPPASGRFFYQADSGLYRAIRHTFIAAGLTPATQTEQEFLHAFQTLGCYLIDLAGIPVDRLTPVQRQQACAAGVPRLTRTLRTLHPDALITVVRSIAPHVRRASQAAHFAGPHFELPYPGRWQKHRLAFQAELTHILQPTPGN